MILDYENGVKSKITRALHYYAERNNKYMNDNNKSIENSHNAQLGFHIQYEQTLSQPFPYNGCEYVEDTSMFTSDFIPNFYKISDYAYTLLFDGDYPE